MIFFFFFFLEKENSRAQSWVDQRQSGWRRKIPPVERKRKEEGKAERKKKDIHNKKALELIERGGYKSEHKSLAPKKTRCV